MTKVLKFFGGLFAALLLGALGSGFWERVLSPTFNYTAELVTRALSSYSQSYSDSIYSAASNLHGSASSAQVLVSIFFVSSMIASVLGLRKLMTYEYAPGSSGYRAFTVVDGWLLLIGGGVIVVMSLFYVIKQSAVRDVRFYALTNMDIARPYIGDKEYHIFFSEFLRVNNEHDFDNFVSALRGGARNAGLEIEKFNK